MEKYYKRSVTTVVIQALAYLGYSDVKINNGQANYKNIFFHFRPIRINAKRRAQYEAFKYKMSEWKKKKNTSFGLFDFWIRNI